ncbi:MAG: hypothetical protein ABS88_01970 [Sphingopyxis sp. SCN 67-31]|nr:MAG: hypothetical protein ABS88_01970 [Sphingopyxis sp. SCN 67-31]
MSVVGIIFFLSVSITGIWMQGEAIFGEDEVAREAMAAITSPVSLSAPLPATAATMERARAAVLDRFGDRPVASVDWVIKAPVPAYVFHLDGAEPVKVTVNAATAAVIKSEPDGEDWVMRLHTGEILGDGGKFLGLAWGLALITMSVTGVILYVKMLQARRTGATGKVRGWRRYFW